MKNSIKALGLMSLLASLLLVAAGCGGQGSSAPSEESTKLADDQASTPAKSQLPSAETEALSEREREMSRRENRVAAREAAVAIRESKVATLERNARSTAQSTPETAPPATSATTTEPSATAVLSTAAMPVASPIPETEFVTLTVPQMTPFDVEFIDGLSSETSGVGDSFRAEVLHEILVDGRVAIPAGSRLSGTVTEVQPGKKIGGQARLGLTFDRLELPSGEQGPCYATLHETGTSQTKKDASTIGGAAAGGGVLGTILGKDHKGKSGVLGAIVGAAVGSVIAARNPGDPVTLDPGTVVALHLEQPLQIVIRQGTPHFAEYATNR